MHDGKPLTMVTVPVLGVEQLLTENAKLKAELVRQMEHVADWVQHTYPDGTPTATIAHGIRERAGHAPAPSSACRCAEIQASDPRRHFKGCPLRKELQECEAPGCPYPAPDHVAGRHFCAGHIDSFGQSWKKP